MNTAHPSLQREVAEIMVRRPIKVDMQDSMQHVASVLHEHGLTSVPVVDGLKQECFGVISLKDVRRLEARHVNLRGLEAWEACTYKPVTVTPDASIETVGRLMVTNRIHHVVVTENGQLKGFVSTLDVIAACLGLNSLAAH